MKANDIKNLMTQKFGLLGLKLQKHSPEILLGLGLVGGIVAAVMAANASRKLYQIEEEHQDMLDENNHNQASLNLTDQEIKKMTVTTYLHTGLKFAKLYGPSVGLGVLSIAAILSSHGIMERRQVSLAAAFTLLKEGYDSYRSRVAEEFGEEKDQEIHLGLRAENYKEKETDSEGNVTTVKKVKYSVDSNHKSMYARLYDRSSKMWRVNGDLNLAFLSSMERYMNDVLILRGYLFLNEVYDALGLPWSSEGQIVGWVLRSPEQMEAEKRDGHVSFNIMNPYNEASASQNIAWLLDFNVDGVVYDLI